MASYSLRRRLQGALVLTLAAVWVALGLATYFDARRELNALFDAHLAQASQLLIAQSGHELMEVDTPNLGEVFPYSQKVAFQVWGADGKLLLRSRDAPATRLAAADHGLADSDSGQQKWRVYSGWTREHTVLVQVAEDRATREQLAARVALNAAAPLLLALPLVALLVSWVVKRALAPLAALGSEVAARQPTKLIPIRVHDIPEEAAPLVERLNDLFARARESLESERRFTANAAHELRNPLAALRLQAEVAAESADPAVSRKALAQVISACDLLTHTVTELLTLARIEEHRHALSACVLDDVVRAVMVELAPHALSRGATLELDATQSLRVLGHVELLQILVRNLLHNAMQHGGDAVRVHVDVTASGDKVLLSVNDSGVGVDAATRAQLGQRFYRGAGAQGRGSGLGLSLVARIAQIHGGSVEYCNATSGSGLTVRVSLARADR